MNNRQKAKHWKQLYEISLPKKPYPVVVKTPQMEHLRVCQMIRKSELMHSEYPEIADVFARKQLVNKMGDQLMKAIIVEEDRIADSYVYSLDCWVERI